MATKGSALSRTLRYFREADHDEARVAHTLVNEIMNSRKVVGMQKVKAKVAAKAAVAGAPKKTWSRRKKVVMPEAQAQVSYSAPPLVTDSSQSPDAAA